MEEIWETNGDIHLDFHSTSAKNGHFGSSTDYISAEHRVVRRTWGARRRFYGLLPPKVLPPTVKYMDIPEEITSEREIRAYLRTHHGQWVELPQEVPHRTRKQNPGQWLRFALTLCAFGLWLLFVIDYWNNAIAYTSVFPFHLTKLLQYANAPYLISAGLPLAVFFLMRVLPDTLREIFPGYRPWNRWYTAAVVLLISLQTALMLASNQFYVQIGLAQALFGNYYYPALRTMTEWYVLSVPVLLCLSLAVWAVEKIVSLIRMQPRQRRLAALRTLKTGFWCIVASLIIIIGSNLILSLLIAMKYSAAAAYVTSQSIHTATNIKSAMIILISAPIMEEIAFRGIICKGLKKTSNLWIAIVISALFFGLWHRNLGQFSYTFLIGLIYGYLFLSTKTVAWPILIHFLNNLLATLAHSNSATCVFGAWPTLVGIRIWMQQWPVPATILGLAVVIVSVILIGIRIHKINNKGFHNK